MVDWSFEWVWIAFTAASLVVGSAIAAFRVISNTKRWERLPQSQLGLPKPALSKEEPRLARAA